MTFTALSLIIDGHTIKIRSLVDAAHALLTNWVDHDGEEYVVAVKTCLDAIKGAATAEDARTAFIKAAKEANIRIITLVHSNEGLSMASRNAA
ncbi:DUF982 domain-containing protein [Rhizobium leguminosarum]|uniref:DUF982 domain-containing protein n=1 Tax=Rhizobium leguminosarum TaxID=384 RepID=UPI0021BC1F47|nr:DUF982 domain-containing protein [Rhizobium leguminosarum]